MSRSRLLALAGCGAALLGLTLLGLYRQRLGELDRFVAVAAAQAIVYLVAVRLVWNAAASRPALAMILVMAALLRLPVLGAAPYLSSDVYRYVWDGRVEAAGINPYRYVPADPHLAALRDDSIFPHINRAAYAPTIYPPVAEAIFLAVTRASRSVTAMKAAMVGFEAITIAVLLRLLVCARLPGGRVLVYAWHPLPLWEFAGSGHIDAALIALVVLALWCSRRGHRVLAGIALAGATLTKLYPAVLLPSLWRGREWRMPIAFAAAMVLGYLPYLGAGRGVLGFLPGYAREEGFTGSGSGFFVWDLVRALPPFAGLPALAYVAIAGAVLAALALAVIFARPSFDGDFAGTALLGSAFIVLLSPHYPWYFAWLIVFACFAPWLSLLWLTNAAFLLYLVQFGSPLMREGYRLTVETAIYAPFAALAIVDVRRRRRVARRS